MKCDAALRTISATTGRVRNIKCRRVAKYLCTNKPDYTLPFLPQFHLCKQCMLDSKEILDKVVEL